MLKDDDDEKTHLMKNGCGISSFDPIYDIFMSTCSC